MLKEKIHGGMGFRCFESLNIALLMKQIWRLCKYPNLLFNKVLKAKYFRRRSVLNVASRASNSYAWKSLCSAIEIYKCGSNGGSDPGTLQWNSGTTGNFSVKEGYRLTYRWKLSKLSRRGEPSDSAQSQKYWKMLWRISVPKRVKIHAWRLFHHALPVFEELKKRGCGAMKEWCFCGYRGESLEHLFYQCWWSKAFWSKLEMEEAPEACQDDISH